MEESFHCLLGALTTHLDLDTAYLCTFVRDYYVRERRTCASFDTGLHPKTGIIERQDASYAKYQVLPCHSPPCYAFCGRQYVQLSLTAHLSLTLSLWRSHNPAPHDLLRF